MNLYSYEYSPTSPSSSPLTCTCIPDVHETPQYYTHKDRHKRIVKKSDIGKIDPETSTLYLLSENLSLATKLFTERYQTFIRVHERQIQFFNSRIALLNKKGTV